MTSPEQKRWQVVPSVRGWRLEDNGQPVMLKEQMERLAALLNSYADLEEIAKRFNYWFVGQGHLSIGPPWPVELLTAYGDWLRQAKAEEEK